MTRGCRGLPALVVLLLRAASLAAQAPEAPELPGARAVHEERPSRDLEAARRQAEALRARLGRADSDREGVLAEVARLDQRLALMRADARVAELRAEQAGRRAREARARSEALSTQAAATRRLVGSLVKALHRAGRPRWHVLLSSATASEASLDSLSVLVLRQRRLASELAAALDQARRATRLAELRTETALRSSKAHAASVRDVETARSERQRRLRDLASDRRVVERLLAEMGQADTTLQSSLARAPRPRPGTSALALPGLSGRQRRLAWPTTGAGTVTERFGEVVNVRLGTRTFRHGVVMRCAQGEAITAVADGRVLFEDWYKGFGRSLVLDHGQGYLSVYGHARDFDVSVGDVVRGGERIGAVGDTGRLDGPHLYFQLNHAGEALDPLQWLPPR